MSDIELVDSPEYTGDFEAWSKDFMAACHRCYSQRGPASLDDYVGLVEVIAHSWVPEDDRVHVSGFYQHVGYYGVWVVVLDWIVERVGDNWTIDVPFGAADPPTDPRALPPYVYRRLRWGERQLHRLAGDWSI